MADGLLDSAYLLYCRGKYSLAYELFLDIALDGDSEAAYCVGCMLLNGTGVETDMDKAKDFLQQAVDGGYVPAMAELADAVAMEEEKRAFLLFNKGALAGDQYAMNRLSKFYDEGIGTKVNPRKGNEWFDRSNGTGDASEIAKEGAGLVKEGNYLQAKVLMMRAGVMGNPLAAAVVSRMYRDGKGVAKSEETSGVWADIAFAYGWNENDLSGYMGLEKWFSS